MSDNDDRLRLDALRDALAPDGEPEWHVDYDDHLEPYVDGTADAVARELVESHVEDCPACAERLRALSAFRAELEGAVPGRRFGAMLARVAGLAAALAALAATTTYLTWRATTSSRPTTSAAAPVRSIPSAEPPAVALQPSRNESPARNSNAAPVDAPSATVLFDGGATWSVDTNGDLYGTATAPQELRDAVVAALVRGEVETPPGLAALASPRERVRGGLDDPDFEIVRPVGTYVRDVRPALQWRPVDGARGYVVTLYDADGAVVATSPRLDTARWEVPASLIRGEIYAWHVTVSLAGKEIVAPAGRPARFEVLADGAEADLAADVRSAGRSHLLRGLAFARVGLVEEAARELRVLATENPGSAAARRIVRALGATR